MSRNNSKKTAFINSFGKQFDLIDKTKDHISFSFEFFTYSEKGEKALKIGKKKKF